MTHVDPDQPDLEMPETSDLARFGAPAMSGGRLTRLLWHNRRLVLAIGASLVVGILAMFVAGVRIGLSSWDAAFDNTPARYWWVRLITVLVFLALQVVFILGLGSVRVPRVRRRSRRKVWVALLAIVALIGGLGTIVVLAATDQMHDNDAWLTYTVSAGVMLGFGAMLAGAMVSGARLASVAAPSGLAGQPVQTIPRHELVIPPGHRACMAMAVALFALFMAILGGGLITALMEWLELDGAAGWAVMEAWQLVALCAGMWCLWLVVAIRLMRGGKESRLVRLLYVGSWVEFGVVLPIHLGQDRSCICATGSWAGLLVGVPLLLWTTGPAIWLLFRHERRMALGNPTMARDILREKTSRGPATPETADADVSADDDAR